MARIRTVKEPADFRSQLAGRRASGSLLEIDSWIPSDVKAISPLVDRLMRLIEGSHCVAGEEPAVELAFGRPYATRSFTAMGWTPTSWFTFAVDVSWARESLLSSMTKDKDLTRMRFQIRWVSKTSNRSTGAASA